jgi:hypothetical protein
MTKFARLMNGEVIECITLTDGVDINNAFHPDLAAQFVAAPGDVEPGWLYDGEWQAPVDPTPEQHLSALQAALLARVDVAAEVERLRYITAGAGQAMTYAEKAAQAKVALAADAPQPADYPLLSAEIGITADTLEGVAGVVDAAYRQWLTIGGMIEAVRLSAKKAISAADTIDAANAAFDAIVWPAASA